MGSPDTSGVPETTANVTRDSCPSTSSASRKAPTPAGLLLVDKPAGMTSHDVVSGVRRLAGTRKVGHAGTLDPAATGLLILGINGGTKLLQYVTGSSKTYDGIIRLGITTVTDDAEGEWKATVGSGVRDRGELEAVLSRFRGRIDQVPTAVSAIKIKGKRAYSLVRQGHEVALTPRPVTISRLDITSDQRASHVENQSGERIRVVDFDVTVECSSGTYIRALARDIGALLPALPSVDGQDEEEGKVVGGHLIGLRRTRIGPWSVDNASSLEDLAHRVDQGEALPILSIGEVTDALFPTAVITEAAASRFRHGQAPRPCDIGEVRDPTGSSSLPSAFSSIGAVASARDPHVILGLVDFGSNGRVEPRTVSVFPADLGLLQEDSHEC